MKIKNLKSGQIIRDFGDYHIITDYIKENEDGVVRRGVDIKTGESFSFYGEEEVEVIDIDLARLIDNRLKWKEIVQL